jgi:hypothetical protein
MPYDSPIVAQVIWDNHGLARLDLIFNMAAGVHYIGTRTMVIGGKPKIYFLGFGGNTTFFT